MSKEDEPTEEDIENGDAVMCVCCNKHDFLELMRDRPEGWYCIECYEDIFE